mmetsp:Transcript_40378/g.72516  ORF Transcript_40378/g.72516 Transcript_40378/m.72516 type:complete len:212 (-) Transcript_40378:140-775(-)
MCTLTHQVLHNLSLAVAGGFRQRRVALMVLDVERDWCRREIAIAADIADVLLDAALHLVEVTVSHRIEEILHCLLELLPLLASTREGLVDLVMLFDGLILQCTQLLGTLLQLNFEGSELLEARLSFCKKLFVQVALFEQNLGLTNGYVKHSSINSGYLCLLQAFFEKVLSIQDLLISAVDLRLPYCIGPRASSSCSRLLGFSLGCSQHTRW